MTTLIVDGANVVGSRPDGWWRDRAGAAARLHARLLAAVRAAPPGSRLFTADPAGGVHLGGTGVRRIPRAITRS